LYGPREDALGQTLEPTGQNRKREFKDSEKQFKSQGAVQMQVEFKLREGSSSWSSGA
jgi:hypothetical protein